MPDREIAGHCSKCKVTLYKPTIGTCSEIDPTTGCYCTGLIESGLAKPYAQLQEIDKMPKYCLEVSWTMIANMTIEANSKEEAINKAKNEKTGLPDGDYLEDSFTVDDVEEEL